MNKRIRELAVNSDKNFALVMVPEETLEKFAVSIVKECADLFPLTFTDEQYQRRIDKTIRKHFGIED